MVTLCVNVICNYSIQSHVIGWDWVPELLLVVGPVSVAESLSLTTFYFVPFKQGLFLSPWSFSCFLKTVHVYIPKYSSIVCLSSNFFCFGHTMWLVESQFSVQGLNTGPQQWKCWTFRDLPELYISGITPYDPFCVFYFLTCF